MNIDIHQDVLINDIDLDLFSVTLERTIYVL
jgi:hypothetical protein